MCIWGGGEREKENIQTQNESVTETKRDTEQEHRDRETHLENKIGRKREKAK